MAQTFDSLSIGRAARQALGDEAEGRVLAVFRRSLYVEMEDGRLACIGGPKLGDGPLNLSAAFADDLDLERSGVTQGDDVRVSGERLTIATLGSIDLTGAAPWHPTPLPTPSNETMRLGLYALASAAGAFESDMGLALPLARRTAPTNIDQSLLDHAEPSIDALISWLQMAIVSPSPEPPPAQAEALVGLGPGLTPSGDDWLGGAMIALTIFNRQDLSRQLSRWALPLAQQRTGKISIAHLAAAAMGEGSAALHNTIATIATADTSAIARALVAIDAIGHSSGWDALAGAAAVMGLIAES